MRLVRCRGGRLRRAAVTRLSPSTRTSPTTSPHGCSAKTTPAMRTLLATGTGTARTLSTHTSPESASSPLRRTRASLPRRARDSADRSWPATTWRPRIHAPLPQTVKVSGPPTAPGASSDSAVVDAAQLASTTTVGTDAGGTGRRRRLGLTFEALEFGPFRWYMGAMIWWNAAMSMQMLARGYLAFQLTGDFRALGIVGLGSGIPMLILSPLGGVIADRTSRRFVLQVGQVSSLGIAVGRGRAALLRPPRVLASGWLVGRTGRDDGPRDAFAAVVPAGGRRHAAADERHSAPICRYELDAARGPCCRRVHDRLGRRRLCLQRDGCVLRDVGDRPLRREVDDGRGAQSLAGRSPRNDASRALRVFGRPRRGSQQRCAVGTPSGNEIHLPRPHHLRDHVSLVHHDGPGDADPDAATRLCLCRLWRTRGQRWASSRARWLLVRLQEPLALRRCGCGTTEVCCSPAAPC